MWIAANARAQTATGRKSWNDAQRPDRPEKIEATESREHGFFHCEIIWRQKNRHGGHLGQQRDSASAARREQKDKR